VEISWFGPKISQSGKIPGILRVYLENPGYTWKIPCDRLGIVPISSILPQILPQCPDQLSDCAEVWGFQAAVTIESVRRVRVWCLVTPYKE